MTITNILHRDLIPRDGIPEYEMNSIHSLAEKAHNISIYRRGIVPAQYDIPQGGRVSIPLLPLEGTPNYKTNGRLPYEMYDFLDGCLKQIEVKTYDIHEGLRRADQHISERGSFIYHVLYTPDLSKKLGPCYSYVSEKKCIAFPRRKRTMIVLPEPVFAGLMAIREPVESRSEWTSGTRTHFGFMLSKDNLFAFEVD